MLTAARLVVGPALLPIARRRGFEPGRVRDPAGAMTWSVTFLGLVTGLLAVSSFSTRWLTWIDGKPHEDPAAWATVLWLVLPATALWVGFLLIVRIRSATAQLLDRLSSAYRLALAALYGFGERFLAAPTLALALAPVLAAVQPGGAPSPSPTPVSPFPAINFPYWWLLSATIWGPVLLALVMAFIPEVRRRDLRLFYGFAFWTTVGIFLLTLFAYNQANQFVPGLQYEENWPWMPPFGISYHLAADGVSIPLLMVSALIAVLAVLASANVRERPRQYFVLLLLTEAAVNGTIAAHDLFVLALFWGAATLPLALLVWGWGGPLRVRAAIRLVAYSALGLAALAGGIFVLFAPTGGASFDMEYAAKTALSPRAQFVISVLLLLAAAVRLPLVPFHGGLRDLFSEAPAGV